jgi:uncharacterized RDD family membrane protein YckC
LHYYTAKLNFLSYIMENQITEERNFHLHQLAHWSQRLINFIVDRLLITLVVILIAPFFSKLFYTWEMVNLEYFILTVFVSVVYYVPFEYFTGKTLGKYLTKTTVLTDGGLKPSLHIIIIRTFCRFIPFELISSINQQGHGWHNTISKTVVLPDSEV